MLPSFYNPYSPMLTYPVQSLTTCYSYQVMTNMQMMCYATPTFPVPCPTPYPTYGSTYSSPVSPTVKPVAQNDSNPPESTPKTRIPRVKRTKKGIVDNSKLETLLNFVTFSQESSNLPPVTSETIREAVLSGTGPLGAYQNVLIENLNQIVCKQLKPELTRKRKNKSATKRKTL
uniref:Homeobox domain-containing protein n=2 Tax=Caenorhabditis tropicalis TaxID=1561998 RepID=A0A1I7V0P2_9PELO